MVAAVEREIAEELARQRFFAHPSAAQRPLQCFGEKALGVLIASDEARMGAERERGLGETGLIADLPVDLPRLGKGVVRLGPLAALEIDDAEVLQAAGHQRKASVPAVASQRVAQMVDGDRPLTQILVQDAQRGLEIGDLLVVAELEEVAARLFQVLASP